MTPADRDRIVGDLIDTARRIIAGDEYGELTHPVSLGVLIAAEAVRSAPLGWPSSG